MIYDDKKFIGQVIKEARKKAGLTQNRLAEEIGMSEKNLGNIENGKQFPQVNNFLHLIEFLDISLADFGVIKNSQADKDKNELIKSVLTASTKHTKTYRKIFELIKSLTE